MSLSRLFLLSLAIRLLLVIYGHWQDLNCTMSESSPLTHVVAVKYTDIDYVVVTDGARYVTEGRSPFLRSTYSAYVYTGNIYFTMLFGKMIMILSDLLVGLLVVKILSFLRKKDIFYTSLWLLNPFVINVSTRGNAESLICLLVLATIYTLLTERLFLSAILYGLSVHFKIYPIIYAPALFFFVGLRYYKRHSGREKRSTRNPKQMKIEHKPVEYAAEQGTDADTLKFKNSDREDVKFENPIPVGINGARQRSRRKLKSSGKLSASKLRIRPHDAEPNEKVKNEEKMTKQGTRDEDSSSSSHDSHSPRPSEKQSTHKRNRTLLKLVKMFLIKTVNRESIAFTVLSASTFLGLGILFYLLYGYEFLYATYFYHLVRKDNRHNFSVYFYHIYLSTARTASISSTYSPTIAIIDNFTPTDIYKPPSYPPEFATFPDTDLYSGIGIEPPVTAHGLPFAESLLSMASIFVFEKVRNVLSILSGTNVQAILLFFPQLAFIIGFSFFYYRYIIFSLFINTLGFVALNKVCTVQYFIWYFALLPLVAPFSRIKWSTRGIAMAAAWSLAQGGWLFFAYELEFLGKNTFFEIWIMGIVYFIVNVVIMIQFICYQNLVDLVR